MSREREGERGERETQRQRDRESIEQAFHDEIYAKCPMGIFQVIRLISNEAMDIVIIREQS